MGTSIKIDDTLKSRVHQLASQRRRSAHGIMLEAIEQYVEREEAKHLFQQEALASWRSYQETGRHLSSDEVRAWLHTWGTGDESALPERMELDTHTLGPYPTIWHPALRCSFEQSMSRWLMHLAASHAELV